MFNALDWMWDRKYYAYSKCDCYYFYTLHNELDFPDKLCDRDTFCVFV